MASLYPLQSILLGLMGWAAMGLVIMNASRLTDNDRRAMIVCSWMLWMIPAFGVLVYRGLMTTDSAAIYCGVTTMGLAAVVIATSVRTRTRP
ncbi:MAG: hypothetical protein HGA65_09910 [Oscillochloris sp.]|nr:hypothetical protein [Oscillochloris sp.]